MSKPDVLDRLDSFITGIMKERDDHRQIALSYKAQVEQQAQQIGALRAEQARLRAERIDARTRAYRQARIFEPSMDGYAGAMAVFRAAFPEDESDGDVATIHIADLLDRVEPPNADETLQAEVEQLRAENERLKSSSDYWKTMADAARQENERLKTGWQPIETAPKQRIVLLFGVTDTAPDGTVRNWKMATGDWHHAYESERVVWTWDGRELKSYDHQPTHWMPLPEAPST